MNGRPAKGSVTPLSSVFPVEEAQKASQRVHDTLFERQKQLDQLTNFISDNSSLINLVHRLPDDLHHSIMVPFGPAAFFPGKIIHTNELMVLLGEGYYAQRTAKQTVDILKRREKGLESQVEGLKAVMDDLKAEASFFDATANEAAEGLVEIREDYIEDTSPAEEFARSAHKSINLNTNKASGANEYDVSPKTNKASDANEDDEYNRILSRLAELEKEEEEAEKDNKIEEDEEESDDSNEDSQLSSSHNSIPAGGKSSERRVEDLLQKPYVPKDGPAHVQDLAVTPLNSTENSLKAPIVKEKLHNTQKEEIREESAHLGISSGKEVIGSIVERSHNIQMNPIGEPAGGRPSRPVSRFKQQRK